MRSPTCRSSSRPADVVTSPENYHIVLGNFADYVMGVRMNPTIRILDQTTSMASNLLVEIVGVAPGGLPGDTAGELCCAVRRRHLIKGAEGSRLVLEGPRIS